MKTKGSREPRQCLHCGGAFIPRREGHVFCKRECRHKGERRPDQRLAIDPDALERLFADDRDPDERVRPDDWHPTPDAPIAALDTFDSVKSRRQWYLNLVTAGRV